MTDDYQDVINLPRHVSPCRKQMPLLDRSAQFAPYSALVGYEDCIAEEGRLTEEKPFVTDEGKSLLNAKLDFWQRNKNLTMQVVHFVPDGKKSGGKLQRKLASLKRIDADNGRVVFQDKTSVAFDLLVDICHDAFGLLN